MTNMNKAALPVAKAATGDIGNGQDVGFESAPLHLKICFGWGLGYLGLITRFKQSASNAEIHHRHAGRDSCYGGGHYCGDENLSCHH